MTNPFSMSNNYLKVATLLIDLINRILIIGQHDYKENSKYDKTLSKPSTL